MNIEALYAYYLRFPHIVTDSRNITADSIFFALKGATFNGNAFAAQALQQGASYVVIDEPEYQADERYLLVPDALKALQELARYHRQQLKIPVVGITGTNGKTTTKELLKAVLSRRFNTYATKGNLNNHIGVPLSILEIDTSIELAIIEMGANHIGEIAFLCQIAQPDAGLITNVGKAHLEGFGSFEGVKKAKGELYDWLEAHQGTLFLQRDNENLAEMAEKRKFARIVTYGTGTENDLSGSVAAADPHIEVVWTWKRTTTEGHVKTHLTGRYNLENVLAAVAAGIYFNLSAEEINAGIENYVPTNNRSQVTHTAHNTIICDYYNANVSSMLAALDNLKELKTARKVVMLGDMFELGDESETEHLHILKEALKIPLERKIFVGRAFYAHRRAFDNHAEFYANTDELIKGLSEKPVLNALILLKASRGMAFERVLDYL